MSVTPRGPATVSGGKQGHAGEIIAAAVLSEFDRITLDYAMRRKTSESICAIASRLRRAIAVAPLTSS
jgi:hypothetical protein